MCSDWSLLEVLHFPCTGTRNGQSNRQDFRLYTRPDAEQVPLPVDHWRLFNCCSSSTLCNSVSVHGFITRKRKPALVLFPTGEHDAWGDCGHLMYIVSDVFNYLNTVHDI